MFVCILFLKIHYMTCWEYILHVCAQVLWNDSGREKDSYCFRRQLILKKRLRHIPPRGGHHFINTIPDLMWSGWLSGPAYKPTAAKGFLNYSHTATEKHQDVQTLLPQIIRSLNQLISYSLVLCCFVFHFPLRHREAEHNLTADRLTLPYVSEIH